MEIKATESAKTAQFELNFSNILQSLMVAGLIGMYVQFNGMKESDTIKGVQMQQFSKDMNELNGEIKDLKKELQDKPRYTQENANSDLQPIKSDLIILKQELHARKEWMAELEQWRSRHELEMQLLKSKK
ncbi:hypothetical protein Phi39:1_gp28 [Cellulophaga phage phi39:1]|uniref:hypothetical protein n=1 Tax=Cellulophaga phage phi39:1 TaxID=1327993 RepID=UPI0003520395|nr:hypothetical protein Phi39:1_gp28 [Cellulophaga phage phi39:1]AGO49143.1 hypothetical protein Phi39:1_gp28 [Cellulophaga phage phi39:1]